MTSEATRKEARDKKANAEALEIAQREADARSEDDLIVSSHTAPLVRDEEHSFVQAEPSEFTKEEIAPDLTKTGVAGLIIEEPTVIVVGADGIDHEIPLTPERLETMTDEEIADAGLLTAEVEVIHPARLSPTSERPRTPLQRSPAAGPGSWPVPEDQLPAVMPSDPPVEEGEDPGDASLTGYPPFKAEGRKVVVFSSEGAKSEVAPDETRNAAALYLRLRNQFPHFTEDQLADEFIIQWEARVGAKQSMRPSGELSQHGLTAVGDERLEPVNLGEARKEATQAQPRSLPLEPSTANTPEAGLPSVNEPATRAKDDEKFGLKDEEHAQDAADLEAMALTKQFHEAEEEAEAEAREKAAKESEKAAAKLPEGSQVPLPPPVRAGASGGERAAEKSPAPKPLPESQRPGPAKSEVKSASKPDEPKKGS